MYSLPSAGHCQLDDVVTTPPQPKKRNRVMCWQCRHDKQGCHPSDRNWDNGEKCKRCDSMDYDCGPPERAPDKPRKKRTTSATAVINQPSHLHSTPYSSHATNVRDSLPAATGHMSSQLSGQQPTRTQKSRPILPFGVEAESQQPERSAPPPPPPVTNTQPEPDGSTSSTRKSGEKEARLTLKRLGDLLATRLLFQSDLLLCDKVEAWLEPSHGVQKIRKALQAAINAIESEFTACYSDGKAFAPRDIGPKEAFLSQLLSFRYRFLHPPSPAPVLAGEGQLATALLADGDVQDMLHELLKRKKIWSAADYLFGNATGTPMSRHAMHTHPDVDVVAGCYVAASEGMKEVVSNIVLVNDEHRNILRGFSMGYSHAHGSISALPPCHLAVPHANASVLLSLWHRRSQTEWDADYLHRTPVHTAAYVGNVHSLQQIFQTNHMTVINTGHDVFGLTPLAITACRDDVKSFINLLKAGASIMEFTRPNFADMVDGDDMGLNLLALASRNGSTQVVKYILERPERLFSFQPRSSELCQALLGGHTHIAQLLIAHHGKAGYDVSNQIPMAIQIAKQKGYSVILTQLSNLMPLRADRHQGIESLDNMAFNEFIDPEAMCDISSFYESSQPTSHFDSQGYSWESQDTPATSFTYSEYQQSPINTPAAVVRARPTSTPHYVSHMARHPGSTRMEPP